MMKRRHMLYSICIIGLLILIAGSFLVPQFIFAVQDSLRGQHISLEKRGNLDITRLNLSYEKSLSKRMTSFSEGVAQGKKYYVAATSYTAGDNYADNEDLIDITQKMLYQNSILILLDMGFLPDSILNPLDYENTLQSWKRYVIYDEDFKNGTALMAWYIDLFFDEGIRLRILTDTETGTLYFAQADYPEDVKSIAKSLMKETVLTDNAYAITCMVNGEYETNEAGLYSSYWEKLYYGNEQYSDKGQNIEISKLWEEFLNSYVPKENVLEIPLSYNGNLLNYKIEYNMEKNQLTVGITEIGELISDFAY